MTKRIAILGGGLMGHGIAQVFACAGHEVRITDPLADVRARIVERIGSNLDDLGPAILILAIAWILGKYPLCFGSSSDSTIRWAISMI
jgi:prephenate dehydrogenase